MNEVTTRQRNSASRAASSPPAFDPAHERQQLADQEARLAAEASERAQYLRPGADPTLRDCLLALEEASNLSETYEREVKALRASVHKLLGLDDEKSAVPNRDAVIALLFLLEERALHWADGIDSLCERTGAWTETARKNAARRAGA